MREQVIKSILENKIIAIVRGIDVDSAVEVAKALYKGGIKLIEVTFNQKLPEKFSDTTNTIRAIKENCPEMIVGAGTVLNIEQVDLAISAGAEYIVSPDTDVEVIKYTVKSGLVSIPGAYTASEAKTAHDAGADFVKLFPCTDATYLKAVKAPLSHIKFLAVGGVSVDNTADFIKAGAVGVGVGSSLINKQFIANYKFDKIVELARRFVEEVGG
ncbi:MAG: bifunctional 4-hydroxy-2-oxoglutarate aldolase/2-dehydro-3-deoxy-phosphogluconate aldolase [Clostridiales bacterium]|nr:bifunctional 4-hydroxy-2-oxoglutarate aldolase/2-dehydro-3-deoxy-phosphogluconate aldolase [Clostridiales bacterium]